MEEARWTTVDHYIEGLLLGPDAALDAALTAAAAAGLPAISVSPGQGRFLHLLAVAMRARSILEIGTLAGYSTIWLARAVGPAGRVVTLELDRRHADVARRNVAHAGLAATVEIRVGPALETLHQLAAAGDGPFDLTFIDADKPAIPGYFTRVLALSRIGSVIIVDNVVRDGALADATSADLNVIGVRRLHELLAGEPRIRATTLQTVGSKGYDGFTMAVVVA